MWSPCSKMVKNFKTVTAKHKSKRGSLLSAQVTLSLKLALFGRGVGVGLMNIY